MAKYTKFTTPEDAAILNRLQPSPNFDRGAADSVDYRAMLAHEKQGRGTDEDFVPLTPAQRVMGEVLMGKTLREYAELAPRYDDTNGVAYNAGYQSACGYHD